MNISFRWAFSILLLVQAGSAWGKIGESLEVFLDNHCMDCHDEESAKADFNLEALSRDLSVEKTLSAWVRIFDRVEKLEMPPPDKKHGLSTRERVEFVAKLRKFLEEADMLVIEKRDRSPVRRITRDEFQHNLRDLLQMPTLDVKDKLPEDRRSHGFVKVAGLLDLSRVHLDAYLDAAEKALTEATAPSVTPTAPQKFKATGVNLFTGLTTFGGREAMFFVRGNKMTPIRKEMKPEELADPTLHLAVFRSATWPYFGYPRNFRASRSGTYRVRFAGRAARQGPAPTLWADRDTPPLPSSPCSAHRVSCRHMMSASCANNHARQPLSAACSSPSMTRLMTFIASPARYDFI